MKDTKVISPREQYYQAINTIKADGVSGAYFKTAVSFIVKYVEDQGKEVSKLDVKRQDLTNKLNDANDEIKELKALSLDTNDLLNQRNKEISQYCKQGKLVAAQSEKITSLNDCLDREEKAHEKTMTQMEIQGNNCSKAKEALELSEKSAKHFSDGNKELSSSIYCKALHKVITKAIEAHNMSGCFDLPYLFRDADMNTESGASIISAQSVLVGNGIFEQINGSIYKVKA